MKILITSDTYLPRRGGGEYHVYYLMRELSRLGHAPVLVTTEQGGADEDGAMRVRRLSYHGIRSIPRIFAVLWSESASVDLIHSHYSYRLACIAGTVAWLRRKPFVITQHGLGLLPQVGGTRLQTLVFRFWRRWSMWRAARVISTSEDLSREIRALGFGDKITAIPNGYDAERFRPLPETKGAPVLLAVRRLVPKTGVQYLLEVLPALRARFPHLRCEIVGDGPLRGALERRSEELGIQGMVSFVGAIPHERILDFYQRAHVVVFPSTAESTSLACIEAMACQKVIVASRVGGLIELLGENEDRGYLVPITDTEHSSYDAPPTFPFDRLERLAGAILHALEAKEEAQGKAREAAAYVLSRFTWEELVQKTVQEVYSPLLLSS